MKTTVKVRAALSANPKIQDVSLLGEYFEAFVFYIFDHLLSSIPSLTLSLHLISPKKNYYNEKKIIRNSLGGETFQTVLQFLFQFIAGRLATFIIGRKADIQCLEFWLSMNKSLTKYQK